MADWQKGDLALCVRGGFVAGRPDANIERPVAGRLYTVEAVGEWCFAGNVTLGLRLADGPLNTDGSREWGASRFRKVTPPKDMELDREVIDLMAGKKVPA